MGRSLCSPVGRGQAQGTDFLVNSVASSKNTPGPDRGAEPLRSPPGLPLASTAFLKGHGVGEDLACRKATEAIFPSSTKREHSLVFHSNISNNNTKQQLCSLFRISSLDLHVQLRMGRVERLLTGHPTPSFYEVYSPIVQSWRASVSTIVK